MNDIKMLSRGSTDIADSHIRVPYIYHPCMPYGYPRNRITRRDNISRVKSPRVQSERVRIERRRYNVGCISVSEQNEIEIYRSLRGGAKLELMQRPSPSPPPPPPPPSHSPRPRCFIPRAPSAFFPSASAVSAFDRRAMI